MASYFVVQSYSKVSGGMTADAPIQARDLSHARSVAQRLAEKKSIVITFTRDGDPKTGDYGDPKLIFAHGDNLPEELTDMEAV